MRKIEFFSTVPGVAETFPILPAKEVMPNWVQVARADYMKSDKREQTVVRCPGVIDLLTTGYVIQAWHDFDIIFTDEKVSIVIPDKGINDVLGKHSLQIQTAEGLAKNIPKRPWSQRPILKINTPFQVFAPKGVRFLMIPLPYTEHFDLESNPGILDPGYSTEINVQCYMNMGNGKRTIKAGTPLAQLIPLTDEKFEMICRDATPNDMKWVQKRAFFGLFGFIYNRNRAKESYERHIEGIEKKCPFSWFKK